jgi:uncharacterized protein
VNALFVDTAGWLAAADAADARNQKVCNARDTWLEKRGLLVTSDYVCDETLTILRFRLGLKAAEEWWRQIENSSRVRIENIDIDRVERARLLFFGYRDKDFSFTDCTSFVLMKELHIRKALTLDKHFRQMGFEVLP